MENLLILRPVLTALWLACLLMLPARAQAAAPDLTAAGVIASIDRTRTYNLGATGLRGWIYIDPTNLLSDPAIRSPGDVGQNGWQTAQSRQILVTVASAPGNAVLAVDDVILGAMAAGSGDVAYFTSDCRKAMGLAIGDAENDGAGTLRVKRWRAGTITDVNIPMTIMGNYSATAPYNCPKSAAILAGARTKLVNDVIANPNFFLTGNYGGAITGLALLAGVAPGDANYATVQTSLLTFARSLASAGPRIQGLDMWHWGYINLFLSEYYLRSVADGAPDTNVVAGINQYTIRLAQSQSMYGTFGHDPSPVRPDGTGRRSVGGYGALNQCGLSDNIAIIMGKKALVAAGQAIDASIDPAIQRGSDFFAWYVNKGGAPYGEHQPVMVHASNGKDAECAVLFGIQDNSQPATSTRLAETEYFARMTLAGFPGREYGHTGVGFSYLWEALGANMGGPEALARYLQQVRWSLDLERRTDGSFVYDGAEYSYDYYGAGTTEGGTYLGFSGCYYSLPGSGFITPTASYLLAYSLPLQRLYITGKNFNPAHTLATAKIDNALAAATYNQDCVNYTTTQLITGLSEFDPLVRNDAATQLATRSLSSADLTTLRGMLTGTDANARMGACQALGLLKDATALPMITQRLDKTIETNSWVRASAANALRNYPPATASTQLTPMLTAFAVNATDPDVIVWDDPIQLSNGYLGFALFGDTIYGWEVNGGANLGTYTINASKSLFYPAVQTGLKQPDSYTRQGVSDFVYNNLTLADVQALPLDIFNLAEYECQADRMWYESSRARGIEILAKFNIAEGMAVALAMLDVATGFEYGCDLYQVPALNALAGYGDAARWTLPTLRGYLGTWDPASSQYAALVTTIASIQTAITSPAGITNLNAMATPQVVATTGAKAITLSGTSCRDASVTFTRVTAPAHGTLSGIPPNLTYTPDGGYTGPDHFTFQVTDSLTTSDPGTVSIIVGAAGTGLKGEYYDNMDFTNLKLTRSDAQVNFDWGSGSPDPSVAADTFSVRWSGLLLVPETGTYKFSTLNSDGVRLYVNGVLVIDDFTDQATHWKDGVTVNLTAGQLVDLQLEYYENTGSAVAKLKWTGPSFAGANGTIIAKEWLFDGTGMTRTPYAHSQSVTLMQNTAQAITLTGSGGALTYSVVTQPTHGTLTGTAPNLTYTPASNYNGSDSFTFLVNNGTGNSAPAGVSLGIMAGLPVSYTWSSAASGNWSVAGNWTSGAPAATGLPNYCLNFTPAGTYTVTDDLNNGFQLNQLNMAGSVTLAGTNSLAFTANGNLLPQFNQNSSSAVTVATPVSLAAMTSFGGGGGGPVILQGLLSGTGGLTVNTVGMVQVYGLTPNTYSGGTVINSGTLHLGAIINGISPFCTGNLGTGAVTLNNGTVEFDNVTAANALTVNGGTLYCNNGWGAVWSGPVTLNATATVNTSYNITLSGNVTGVGGLTKTNVNTLYLSGTNSFTGSNRIAGGTLSCSKAAALGTGPLNISTGAKATLNYSGTRTIASLSLGGTAMPAGSYGSTASSATNKNDSYFSGTGTVTAGSPNSAPVASSQSVSTAEDTAKPITLTATDADGNPLTYSIVTQPAHGTLSGTAPNVTYAPMLNYYGTDGFTFKANDGALDSTPATVSITVTAVNDAPVATFQRVTTATNTAKAITLAGTDVEGSALTYAIVTQPAHGSLSGSASNVTYTPAANYSGGDSFTFKVNDGTLDSAPATVLITVTSASQAITVDAQVSAQSSGSVTINLTAEFLTSLNASSKLVVMTSGRGSGGSIWGKSLTGITYGSTNLTPAINVRSNDVSPTAGGEEVAGIYYLDHPGATPATTITITYAGVMDTSSGYTLLALSGTTPGVSVASGGVTPGVVMSGATALTTTAANSLVLAVGAADRATTTPQAPLSLIYSYTNGTYGAGSQTLVTPGLVTPTFTYSAAKTTPVTVAAAFAPADTTPPTTAGSAIVDDKGGGPVTANTLVTYTMSFSEEMDASTVSAADFGNAGTAAVTIGTVAETTPGVFTVPVTPTSTGTLQLKVNAGAALSDVAGNALVTTSAIVDDTLITVMASSTTTLVSSPVATGSYGTAATFTANVTTGATGMVTFKDGTTVLGTGTLDGSGQATYATSALMAANHPITATYGGDATYAGSVSASCAYVVTPLALTLAGVTAADKIYDGNATAALTGGTLIGTLVGSETVTVVPGSGSFASPNAGNWSVTATGYSLGGPYAGNYVLSAQPAVANATITPRPLQLTGTRTYDAMATVAAASLTIANKISGDDLSMTGSVSLAGKDVGSQAILSGYTVPIRVRSATGFSSGSSSTSLTVAMAAAPASGNTLVAVISTRGATANQVSGISSTAASWTRATQSTNASGSTTEIWYAPVGASAGATVSISTTAGRCAAVVVEYSGTLAATALDQFNNSSSSGSGTAPLTGTTPTTAQACEVWIGAIGYRTSAPTLGTLLNSFAAVASAQSNNGTAGNNAKVYALERIVTAAGTAASGGTLSAAAVWSGAIATFKAAPLLNLALSGTSAANYTLTGAPGAVTITPKALTLTTTPSVTSKTYDGLAAATLTGATLRSAEAAGTGTAGDGTPYAGDTASVLSQAFLDPNAGTGNKVIVPNIIISDGNGGANYALNLTNFAAGTITKAAAAVTLGNLAQTYDASPKSATATTDPAGKRVTFTYDGSSTTPSAAGSYVVVATIDDPNYSGTATGTLVIAVAPLVAWRDGHFSAAEISAGLAADNVDADGDGFTNLAEYTLGTDPRGFSPQPLAIAAAADNHFTLSFLARRASGAGYTGRTRTYTVEASADPANPGSWRPVSGYTNLVGGTQTSNIVGDDQTVIVTLPDTDPSKFYRLNVRVE